MSGPLSSIRFAHAVIAREWEEIEHAAQVLPYGAGADVLAQRLDFFADFLRQHNEAEERTLFPALAEKIPFADAVYLQDHEEQQLLMRELLELARAVADGDRDDALPRLRRQTVALAERSHAHTVRENTLLIAHLEALLSPSEQLTVHKRFLACLEPHMNVTVPWIAQQLPPLLRAEFLDALGQEFPRELVKVAIDRSG
jgi:hemerythrin-like domain-containing protein